MSVQDALVGFHAPGPVAQAFMDSMLPTNLIMGPVGSGKTSCLMVKNIRLASMQPPSKYAFELVGGAKCYIRYSKAIFVRETFRQLYGTTIPSWLSWFPKAQGQWRGGGNEAGSHQLKFHLPGNGLREDTVVDFTALFEALGDQSIEDLMRGKEFNLANLNEADRLAPDVLPQVQLRIGQGRFPGEKHVDPALTIKQVNADYNAPDIENYLYKMTEENRADTVGFFRQPGGLDAKAENRERARREDYEAMEADLISQGREDLARRMIHNQYGFTRDGKPVYPEYRDDFHCAGEELLPVKGLVVRVDFDQGLHPACILRQTMPDGQLRVLDELYSDAGAKGLCEDLRRLIGSPKYAGIRVIGGKCDPAGVQRSGDDAEPWIAAVNRYMGWIKADRVRAADTNEIDKRHSAVRYRLNTSVGDGRPGLLISSTCRVLRKGFAALYRFKRVRGAGEGDYQDKPDKKFPIADVHDALQYGALDDGGYEEVTARAARKNRLVSSGMIKANVEVRL